MQITIHSRGVQIGPLPVEQVNQLLQSGGVTFQDMGWTPGMPDWRPLSEFAELQSAQGSVLPPPPTSPKSNGYYLAKKKIQVFGDSYHIYDAFGNVLYFAMRKSFSVGSHIAVYDNEDMQRELLHLKEKFSGGHDVYDSINKNNVGSIKLISRNTLAKQYRLLGSNKEELGLIKETHVNIALGIVRAGLSMLPVNAMPTKYEGCVKNVQVCHFEQEFNAVGMTMKLDFSMDKNGLLDRRLGIAGAIVILHTRDSGPGIVHA
jgi:GYF domain 2